LEITKSVLNVKFVKNEKTIIIFINSSFNYFAFQNILFSDNEINVLQSYCFANVNYSTQHNSMFYFSFESNQIYRFWAADFESVFRFFPARQVSEIILNESSKNTENALIEWLRKEITMFLTKTKVYLVSLILSLVFKTGFGIFLAPLSCLKSVKWEMSGNFQVRSQRILWFQALKSLLGV
jgi:hypothetical protein